MAKLRAIVWSAEAESDLFEIRAFIAGESPHYAEVVAARLYDAVGRLAAFPESGRIVPEISDPHIREVIYGPYRLVYELRVGRIEILTVFRSERDFPRIRD